MESTSTPKPIRIHDTVHGYITLPWKYAMWFVDTPQFQRLRRIEQSAVRALYPTARHDRFTHSLGVYHVGCLIEEHFRDEMNADYLPEKLRAIYIKLFNDYPEILESFKISCLLHDVGHAPFSHTFEDYFGGKDVNRLRDDLFESMAKAIPNNEDVIKRFKREYEEAIREDVKKKPKSHEITSAIVCVRCYSEEITRINARVDYVVRMILGMKFLNPVGEEEQLTNIFIELLHGETIDADRLDYACRDTWASGYCTSTVDMRRLIYAMHIRETAKGVVLCYNDKVINEIESLLSVKDFQIRYIFNHHVIRYDQHLLEMAAKTMARQFCPQIFKDKDDTDLPPDEQQNKAMACFINVDALTGTGRYCPESNLPEININISHIADEDILFLMKQKNNPYYEEWASRQYKYYPLWKTRDEFHALFPDSIEKGKPSIGLFEKKIREALQCTENPENVIILSAEFKGDTPLDNLKLWSNERVVEYRDLYPQEESKHQIEERFFYVYYKNKYSKEEYPKREEERRQLLEMLEGPINAFYRNPLD